MPHGKKPKTAELYDLSADPSETSNVISMHPQVKKELTEKITSIVRNGRTTSGKNQANDTPWWDALTWMKPW